MTESLFAICISALVRSLRVEWRGEPLPERAIISFWHSRMLAGWFASKKNSVAMVSKSKDGEYLGKILTRWGYKLVRGSSGKGGMEALAEAIALLKNGDAKQLAITPDGPQGPPQIFKRGAFIAARELGLPFYFLEIEYRSKKILSSSWDKFQVPYPFSKLIITSHKIEIPDLSDDYDKQAAVLKKISLPFQTITG